MRTSRLTSRAALLALLTFPTFVPAQQGLAQRVDAADAAERRAAVIAIGALGDKARPFVPQLIERMADPDLDVAVAVVDACSQLGAALFADTAAAAATNRDGQALLVTAAVLGHAARSAPADRQAALQPLVDAELGSEDPRRRMLAAAAFGALAECGVATGTKLLRVLAERGSIAAPAASRTLSLHGERLLPLLRALVQAHPELVSTALVDVLPAETKEQVDLLATIARQHAGYPRRNALWRLSGLGRRAAEHLELFAASLEDPLPDTRGAAVAAFHRACTDEDRVAAVLADALMDRDQLVVQAALDELRSERLLLPGTVTRLVTLLGSVPQRNAAADLLGSNADVRRATLQPALGAADPDTQIAAVRVLVRRGLATDADLAPVGRWLHSEASSTRQQALLLVQALSGSHPELLPRVVELLRGPDRARAIAAVASFGKKAQDALGRLLTAMKDQDPDIRREAAYALALVAPGRRDCIDALVRGVKDPAIAGWCTWGIAAMGREGKAAADGLRRLLADPDVNDRSGILGALAAVADVDATVTFLVRIVANGRNEDERVAATTHLRSLFQREQVEDRVATKAAKLSAAWRAAVKALLEVIRTGSPTLRGQAYETLGLLVLDDAADRCVRAGLREQGGVLASVLRAFAGGPLTLTTAEIDLIAEILRQGEADLPELAASTLALGGPDAQQRLFASMREDRVATRRAAVLALPDLPWRPPFHEAVLGTLSTSDRGMRLALSYHFRLYALEEPVAERVVACWDKAGDDLALRRTLAEITAGMLLDTCAAADRLRARLCADTDPIVQIYAARVAPR